MPYGAPELAIVNVALSQIAHSYDPPYYGTGCVTDFKLIDGQALLEAGLSALTTVLSGTNFIHGVSCIEGGVAGNDCSC